MGFDLAQTGAVDFRVPRTGYRDTRLSHLGDRPHYRALSLPRLRHNRQNPTEISNFGISGSSKVGSHLHFTLQEPFGQCHVSQLWEKPCRSQSSRESFPSFALHYCRLLPVAVVLRLLRSPPHVSWHLISSSSLSGEVRE